MSKLMYVLLLTVALVVLVPIVALAVLSLSTGPARNIGMREGRLSGCPGSPNCVSSEASDTEHRIEPLRFEGTPNEAMDELVRIVESMPRSRIVTRAGDYLHVEFRSRVFRFVDDLEFLIDARTKMIACRSAARVGYSDFGVNRDRLEKIRAAFEQWSAARRSEGGRK
ncbi:hypothetical protein Pan216_27940 [Planctomycetes bacterium Pan216]|uniref:DUF1499 domain-containing protein n=1 Tax=Kolteria novifilia TaxID=2527975 RepID=A0A518B4L8_9BACT|nr:hypothetical protein Pan216_27940 [Planctomycetes bacterium Pan216]